MRGLSDCESDVKRLRRPSRGATPANRLYTGTYTARGEGEGYFLNFIFSKNALASGNANVKPPRYTIR